MAYFVWFFLPIAVARFLYRSLTLGYSSYFCLFLLWCGYRALEAYNFFFFFLNSLRLWRTISDLACGRDENQWPAALLAKTKGREIGWPATWTVDVLLCVKNSFITESFFKLIYWPARRLVAIFGAFCKWKVFSLRLPFGAGGIHRQRWSLIQCNKRSSVFGRKAKNISVR